MKCLVAEHHGNVVFLQTDKELMDSAFIGGFAADKDLVDEVRPFLQHLEGQGGPEGIGNVEIVLVSLDFAGHLNDSFDLKNIVYYIRFVQKDNYHLVIVRS